MFRVEVERRNRGWTQRQLAELAGMLQPHVSLLERGRLIPTSDELRRLARALVVEDPTVLMEPVFPEAVHGTAVSR